MELVLLLAFVIGALFMAFREKKEISDWYAKGDGEYCTACKDVPARYLWCDGDHLCEECDKKKMDHNV